MEAFHDGASQGMLVPLDVNVNCRVRRNKHVMELLPAPATEQKEDNSEENRYIGGRLFGGEGEDHEL